MKILTYSSKDFEIPFLEKSNNEVHHVKYIPDHLTSKTAALAMGFDAICISPADDGSTMVLERLKDFNIKYIVLRSTGYDNINLTTAQKLNIKVANAAGYSPITIAEHGIALLLAIKRKLIQANQQVNTYNFSLSNLVGTNLNQKTVGVIGTGRIGKALTKILYGFGCTIVGHDIQEDKELVEQYDMKYMDLENICRQSDIFFLSTPLNTQTYHLINKSCIDLMKKEVIIVNIARGAIVDTKDIITALISKKIAAYAADVYEYEQGVFFYDRSKNKPDDTVLKQLIDLPNVLLTAHQAFATKEALTTIADTTFYTINCWDQNKPSIHELTPMLVR